MRKRVADPLDPRLVIHAYAQGIFPMADQDGAIHWYAPDPRAVLEHDHLHVSRSLRATPRDRDLAVLLFTLASCPGCALMG